ncbi:hypothetical protein D5281_13875 [bacterium 1xD42-62]|uniref:Uncharacterized protein n=1 Tax=Parablautia muri TaxID=2320879 RepID=A0A9X5BH29_9FIRM|nr:hypothetical protein [Parablautia muri]
MKYPNAAFLCYGKLQEQALPALFVRKPVYEAGCSFRNSLDSLILRLLIYGKERSRIEKERKTERQGYYIEGKILSLYAGKIRQ